MGTNRKSKSVMKTDESNKELKSEVILYKTLFYIMAILWIIILFFG